jgi:hypothetical protein
MRTPNAKPIASKSPQAFCFSFGIFSGLSLILLLKRRSVLILRLEDVLAALNTAYAAYKFDIAAKEKELVKGMLINLALEFAWQKSIKLSKDAVSVPHWSLLRDILQQRVTTSHRMAFDMAFAAGPSGGGDDGDRFVEIEPEVTKNGEADDDVISRRLLASVSADIEKDLSKVRAHRKLFAQAIIAASRYT